MSARPELVLVAALARDSVIGRDGGLPWSLPEDMRHFRAVTTGHAVIMGRKTHESIGRPLPNRRNLVITRDASLRFEGCEVVSDLETAIAHARTSDPAPRVIGGAAIYALALPLATELRLTEIDREIDGDAFFPPFHADDFECVERRAAETEGLTFVTYRRRSP